jgi:8-amino-7-oxononanoate synthase
LISFREAARNANAELRAAHLARAVDVRPDCPVDFSSNDYLGLARHPALLDAVRGATAIGSGGSRLLSGAAVEHDLLERDLASFLGRERVRLFSSGYLGVLGAVATAARLVTAIHSDAENHACAIDAIRLTGLPKTIYRDAAPPAPARDGATLLVTESLFSMSGRSVDLAGLLRTLGPADALLVDEAHAIGVLGPAGRGLAAGLADDRVVVVGTLSKAFGCLGGFVAGTGDFIDLLTSTARSFIFDTSLPPALAAAARTALDLIANGDALRARLFENVATFWDAVDLPEPAVRTHIASVIVGGNARSLAVARRLRERGYFAPAIRPPTVPSGSERLRASLRANHLEREVRGFARTLTESLAACR